jgi:hypothetical protein
VQLIDGGDWTGAAAEAFEQQMVEPVCRTMSAVARELERMAGAMQRGAMVIEETRSEHRRAEAMAIAAGVLVGLGMVTFALTDVAAVDAANAAVAMMARAAAAAATGMRAVALAMEEVEAAIGTLTARLSTGVLSAAAVAPRLMEGPLATGLFGALGTAATGDMSPEDWLAAMALGYLEGKAGELGGEPAVPGLTKAGVPRRYPYDIERFEGVDRAHVIAVHCAERAPELGDRLRFDPDKPRVSTFRDRATAHRAVQEAIDADQQEISAWLASGRRELLRIRAEADTVVGEVLTRETWLQGRGPMDTRRLRIVLQRSGASPTGFVVLTAFPELKK